MTYIRTWQGWLYLAIVMDLFVRIVVDWAPGTTSHRKLALKPLLLAGRLRRLRGTIIHSEQDAQYGCDARRRFCRNNRSEPNLSRIGDCCDNASVESFTSILDVRSASRSRSTGRANSPRGDIRLDSFGLQSDSS